MTVEEDHNLLKKEFRKIKLDNYIIELLVSDKVLKQYINL